jgi:FKBP12-rapamycin complex-associated protein
LDNADNDVVIAAAKVMGRIAEVGGAMFGEALIRSEVAEAMGKLQKEEKSRYGSVLILKELARNLSPWFAPHVTLVFDKILVPLRDSRVSNVKNPSIIHAIHTFAE